MEGPLSKWTNVMKGWQYRWFVLDESAGILSYYTSKEKMMRGARRGCVRLKGAIVGIDDDDDSTFTITVDGKTFHFQSYDADGREKWIRALEDVIVRHAAVYKRWNPTQPVPTMADFDSKLTESDAYLQILIDQASQLGSRIDETEAIETRLKLEIILNNLNRVIESVKRCIVLLQIAKNTAFPMNGVYQPCNSSSQAESLEGPKTETFLSLTTFSSAVAVPAQVGVEIGKECTHVDLNSIDNNTTCSASGASTLSGGVILSTASNGSLLTTIHNVMIPERSYSSSEDEDYFDASDFHDYASSTYSNPKCYEDAIENFESGDKKFDSRNTSPLRLSDPMLDFDSMYDEDDLEIVSLEGHGSIIQHLISQVKIGMDLTKVALPTFILERRSLLEMYADFFAHPDFFCGIADYTEPRDRMVQVVKWYLSAFHAGRRSEVARKPYNPILGEVFRCYWDVQESQCSRRSSATHSEDTGQDQEVQNISGGPVPWASADQLAFVAEQVSHHPPVSAFYAEQVSKKISFCGHIWTKSKFLGLSVCVQNIGQGCISLQEYDEEYILNFPSGYGRSILTVPWVELGGTCQITCSKTGYNANVEFSTKPFYGGKKHRIFSEVFSPGDKKPFMTVEGEWNGCMVAKWTDGRSEVLVDTTKIPIVKKNVKRIVDQEANESRVLWKEVTAGLKFNNIHEATRAKFAVEQKQRKEAKERKENKITWHTKLFSLQGDNWLYNDPLQKRVYWKSSYAT